MNKEVTQHFWEWFLEHKNKLKTLRQLDSKEQGHYTFWLDWHLQFYFPGLEYILIFPKLSNEKTQLIITTCGKQKLFSIAVELEKTAPKLCDWKFTVFIQPTLTVNDSQAEINTLYILEDITLKTSKPKFIPLDYDGVKKTNMIVCFRNFTIYSHNKNLSLLINIIKQLLQKEKSLQDNITLVQLAEAPEQEEEFILLYDLQFYLDEINKIRAREKNKNQT